MKVKRFVVCVLTAITLILSGCSSKPCINCGDTPTKGYENERTGEKEYYCKECSSECTFCWDEADRHYTGGGGIIFICEDCYEDLKDYGWID